MKCTCKDWDEKEAKFWHSKPHDYKFCPWCSAPLLPDPVEKTEWFVTSSGGYQSIDEKTESFALEVLENRVSLFPTETHTLKSITTIERVVKVVRLK